MFTALSLLTIAGLMVSFGGLSLVASEEEEGNLDVDSPDTPPIEKTAEFISIIEAITSQTYAIEEVANLGENNEPLIGSSNDELLIGSTSRDEILGNGGADTISTFSGDDIASGGDDNDVVLGGAGHDALHGQAGKDLLLGEEGHDTLYGGSGNDTLSGGGPEQDVLLGGDGDDFLVLGAGDYAVAGAGEDNLVLDLREKGTAAILADFQEAEDVIVIYSEENISDMKLSITVSEEPDGKGEIRLNDDIIAVLDSQNLPKLSDIVFISLK